MEKKIEKWYIIALIIGILFVLASLTLKENDLGMEQDNEVYEIENLPVSQEKNDQTPCGIQEVRKFNLPQLISNDKSLMCYTIHQNVYLYCDGELRYSLEPSPNNLFGKTPGCQWSKITLGSEDAGKEITIVTVPVYQSSIGLKIMIFYGSEYNIFLGQLKQDAFIIVLSILVVLFGAVFVIYSLVVLIAKKKHNEFWIIGVFSMELGIWKITDLHIVEFIFRNSITISLIPFITLLLLSVPFGLYVKMFFQSKDNKLWYVPVFFSFANIIATYSLQLLQILDFRETLTITHISMAISFIVAFVMLIYERVKYGINKILKISTLCIAVCFAGTVADVWTYYKNPIRLQLHFGMIAFLFYMNIIAIYSYLQARKLLQIGKEADHYKEMAYMDPLTGLYNRAFFMEQLEEKQEATYSCRLITFDLNNLKYCNDTFGHEAGDRYIVSGAQIIKEAFGKYGNCFRIGGDEFWVVLNRISADDYQACIEKLEKRIAEMNDAKVEKFKIGIAYGMAEYDANADYTLNETMRRADKQMYKKKMQMKETDKM